MGKFGGGKMDSQFCLSIQRKDNEHYRLSSKSKILLRSLVFEENHERWYYDGGEGGRGWAY